MIVRTLWNLDRPPTMAELEQAWPNIKADLISFMRGLDHPLDRNKEGKIRWLYVPDADIDPCAVQPDEINTSDMTRRLNSGAGLSLDEQIFLVKYCEFREQKKRGAKKKHTLSLQMRDEKIALCAIAMSEFYNLNLMRRHGETMSAMHKKTACDAVSDAITDLFQSAAAPKKVSAETVRKILNSRADNVSQDRGSRRAQQKLKDIARDKFQFMKKVPEERARRLRQIDKIVQDVLALPDEAFGDDDQSSRG